MTETTAQASAFFTCALFSAYGFEPSSFHEATNCPEKDHWWQTMETEMASMERLSVFEYVLRSSLAAGVKILTCKWVYKIKPDKYKSRLCILGCFQRLDDLVDTFSPTLKSITFRLLMALAAYFSFVIEQMDVCNAFLNAKLPSDQPVHMHCVLGRVAV